MLSPISRELETYMSLLNDRQSLVSSNIANADTPGYKTKDIDMDTSFEAYRSGILPAAQEVSGLTLKNDGNNVDLDRESRLLAENTLRFSIASNLLRSQLRIVRSAIEGGTSQGA
jgi:flagellar basal-body rod protein FlgB